MQLLNEGTANVHLQFMDCSQIQSRLFCPAVNIAMSNNFKHSHVHFTQYSSIKARFSHTSTVTGLHSCSGKKKIRVRLACILFLYRNHIFEHF